jgi:hypothetical protein
MNTDPTPAAAAIPTPEWPLVFYFVVEDTCRSVSEEPKLESIQAKQRGERGFAYAKHHSFFGYRFSSRVKHAGAELTPEAAWKWYKELQLNRISRAKEQIATAELRLKQISKHL